MFSCCTQLEELDLSHFNTRKVTDMSYMFYWSNNLTKLNINQFNTSNVANMSSMFSMCRNLNSLIYRDEAITRSDFIAKLVPEGCKTDSLFDNCGLN
jgi:surface protein